jgi:hypothetical protein
MVHLLKCNNQEMGKYIDDIKIDTARSVKFRASGAASKG